MTLAENAERAARLLSDSRQRVVFAESCTAGLVSAQLAAIPGISDFHCGSLVTYRNRSKQDWLSIPAKLLDDPGPVSEIVAAKMAQGALQRTSEADLAISVTGHLGPNAPPPLDGLIFIGTAVRLTDCEAPRCRVARHRLTKASRLERQREAAGLVLHELCRELD